MAHLSGNTSGVSKTSTDWLNYTGFLGDVCHVPPGNKDGVPPNTPPPPVAKRLMHMAHLSGNTSVVSKSSSDWLNYTGFLGDVCRVL